VDLVAADADLEVDVRRAAVVLAVGRGVPDLDVGVLDRAAIARQVLARTTLRRRISGRPCMPSVTSRRVRCSSTQ
jgi:hypothetical protein